MRTIHTVSELRSALAPHRTAGKTIGFVPTMGALHEGHLSLVRLSKLHTDVTVVSIFVNPTQFGANEDFGKYPRTLEADMGLLVEADVEFLFAPSAEEMYPAGFSSSIHVAGPSEGFEGAIRPGHFSGVATVVASLLNIVQPTVSYFGQKDAQQVAVIKRMVRDLHIPVEITVGETIRKDGKLALSSRNRYLSESDMAAAEVLSEALMSIGEGLSAGLSLDALKSEAQRRIRVAAPEATIDYLDAVNSETFQPVGSFVAVDSITVVVAARFGATRLLDNIVVTRPDRIP